MARQTLPASHSQMTRGEQSVRGKAAFHACQRFAWLDCACARHSVRRHTAVLLRRVEAAPANGPYIAFIAIMRLLAVRDSARCLSGNPLSAGSLGCAIAKRLTQRFTAGNHAL
jgi:hypothetical protein